jgi:sulfane dehydrogenase subunit SoxC
VYGIERAKNHIRSKPAQLWSWAHIKSRGLAWSGRGRVSRVEISCDGGSTWQDAALGALVLPKAFTRFTLPWRWDGKEAWILSRATDDGGDTQPTREQIVSVRGLQSGPDGFNHYNGIKAWHVSRDGEVTHV